jgi:serine/threonine protein kinase
MTFLTNDTVARLRDAATRPALAGDRYVLGDVIGRGGMGAVYAAHDRLLDREVAIKVSNIVIGPADRERADDQDVQAEARMLARLEHPGIVPVHDAGLTTDGRVFYAMKLIRGRTLADHMKDLPALSGRLSIFERMVEAVAFAHHEGIVHRDLSVSNVMIGSFGEVLVLDWGVAQLASAASSPAAPRIGTRGFMAPEREATPRTDVFSLGAILTVLIDGLDPPKRLRAIAAKCQAATPADRYSDASALADDLARLRAGQPVTAYRDTVWDHARVWLGRYGVFAALILAYLVMRAAVALRLGR